ncbi:MAG TPA: HD domain-containing phosphohydrolase, partial [Deinococcales bacterium]|nr:HD domain-containing phosphohydrolase [Deinococcales bacterium]
GAKDFLTKPFDPTEVLLRIRNLLETRNLHLRLKDHNRNLEQKVQERTHDLEASQLETLDRLAAAGEFRDTDTGLHTTRVGRNSGAVAARLGLGDQTAKVLALAARLHDVGKIGIPDAVLLKPGKLTDEEYAHMRSHTVLGGKLLQGGGSELMRLAEEVARTHHERWDGTGYPNGLKGDEIPISGRIVALVDAVDAMLAKRPYKEPRPLTEVITEVQAQAGRHFDPAVVEAFLQAIREDAFEFPEHLQQLAASA